MNREREGEAHRSPWPSFKERALYLTTRLGKFRIWYLYGLYKIEKALPEGKTKSMGGMGVNHLKKRREGGKLKYGLSPLVVGLKKNITKTLDQ
jgi:hypothetical protein